MHVDDRHAYQRIARSLGYALAGPIYRISDRAFAARFVTTSRTGKRFVARSWVRCDRSGEMWSAEVYTTKRAAVAGVLS